MITPKQAKRRFRRGFNRAWLQNVRLGCYQPTPRQVIAKGFTELRNLHHAIRCAYRPSPVYPERKRKYADLLAKIMTLNQKLTPKLSF